MQMHSSETVAGIDDLARAVHDRRLDLFLLFELVIDVFDRHRGVVHQNADRQRQIRPLS